MADAAKRVETDKLGALREFILRGWRLHRGLLVGQCAIDVSPWATAVVGFGDDPIGSQLT